MDFRTRTNTNHEVVLGKLILICDLCLTGELSPTLDLGTYSPANSLKVKTDLKLIVAVCNHCSTVHIPNRFPKEITFPRDYPFRSNVTKALKLNFESLADVIESIVPATSSIIEIGSNDGILLGILRSKGYRVTGVEPTSAALETPTGIPVIKEFFEDCDISKKYNGVILTNTFAHMDDQNATLKKIKEILLNNGLLIIEVVDLDAMFEKNEFDKFTHEHKVYFDHNTLRNLVASHGFQEIYSEKIPTHGGSIRCIFQLTGESFKIPKLSDQVVLDKFQSMKAALTRISAEVNLEISKAQKLGMDLFLAGATTRGVTLMRSLEVDAEGFYGILEKPESKRIDTVMPNIGLLVRNENEISLYANPFVLILAWHVADELIANLKKISSNITFLVPLPNPRLVVT
ncbi:AdoMet_MTases domain containing protein [Candidatus Nanopelagicaceae bacterium]